MRQVGHVVPSALSEFDGKQTFRCGAVRQPLGMASALSTMPIGIVRCSRRDDRSVVKLRGGLPMI